jgi:hypothetical protein
MWWLVFSGVAAAVEPRLEASLGASGWALGLRGQFRPGYTQHLWGADDDILFKDTYVRGLAEISLTPSYARIGPEIGFSPIAVFEMRAGVAWSEYFGTFSSIIGFEDPDAVPSADALQREADLGYRDHGWSVRYSGGATLQAQFGPVVIYTDGALRHWITHPGPAVRGSYFYEPEISLVLAFEDTTFECLGLLGFELPDSRDDRSLLLGSGTLGAMSMVADDLSVKTGLVGVYRFDGTRWQILGLVAPYLVDRTFTSPFPPYVAGQVTWLN